MFDLLGLSLTYVGTLSRWRFLHVHFSATTGAHPSTMWLFFYSNYFLPVRVCQYLDSVQQVFLLLEPFFSVTISLKVTDTTSRRELDTTISVTKKTDDEDNGNGKGGRGWQGQEEGGKETESKNTKRKGMEQQLARAASSDFELVFSLVAFGGRRGAGLSISLPSSGCLVWVVEGCSRNLPGFTRDDGLVWHGQGVRDCVPCC